MLPVFYIDLKCYTFVQNSIHADKKIEQQMIILTNIVRKEMGWKWITHPHTNVINRSRRTDIDAHHTKNMIIARRINESSSHPWKRGGLYRAQQEGWALGDRAMHFGFRANLLIGPPTNPLWLTTLI